jgi:ZIP family zinc transporter
LTLSTGEVLLLGGIAGLTIFFGLPIGRIRNLALGTCAFFNAVATGVLAFLLVETLSGSIEPVDRAVDAAANKHGSWGTFAARGAVFLVCFGLGLVGLVYYDRWMARRGARSGVGPGTAAVQEFGLVARVHSLTEARRLALFIAVGIGLHNFSEGLAIGQSAARNEVSLALLLIIGFGLHNATEGFGIVAPLASAGERPTWGFLTMLGLIGGGPTFLGTVVGQAYVNAYLNIAFLALAAGSILYVIVQLLHVASKLGHKELLMWGLLVGLVLGFGTDFVLVAAGA